MIYLKYFYYILYLFCMCDCSCHSVCVEVRGELEDILPSTIWVPYIKPK